MKNKNMLMGLVTVSCFSVLMLSCSQQLSAVSSSSGSNITAEPGDEKEPVLLNEIGGKVLRSFYKSFGELSGVTWLRSANGFVARFRNKDRSYSVYYKINGVEECRVISYLEDQLTLTVRHLVKSAFYDDRILHITEIQKNSAIAYYVKIENSKKIRTLKIVDHEWELAEEIFKQ